ncbi:MAG: DUF305 domain-containing protein [Candidatus Saccharibacteria bacterium]
MDTKNILTGLTGLIIGGLIVSVAANNNYSHLSSTSMGGMTASMQHKSGDDFDKAFLVGMIEHHEGAVAMAKLAQTQSKHEEVKKLAGEIINAQEKEIDMMQTWQEIWGYTHKPSIQSSGDGGAMMQH